MKRYLLTCDLENMMGAYERVGIKIPDQKFFTDMQGRLVEKLKESLLKAELEVIPFKQLVTDLAVLLQNILRTTPEAVILSTVPEIAAKLGGHCLQVNRIVDSNGQLIGIGPRPGYAPIIDQLNEINSFIHGRSVILVEDGSFSGSTMKEMIRKCSRLNIKIDHVAAGFLFDKAKKKILEEVDGNISVHCCKNDNFLDWMPDHDFYPFIPNCGRIVGYLFGDQALPIYLHNGLSLSMPYTLPYGDPVKWASIPEEKKIDFSLFCLHETISLFREMEKINNTTITLENLIGTYPKASFPVTPSGKGFPSIKTNILEILSEDAHSLI